METILPPCPACTSHNVKKNGHQNGKQRYRCRDCQKTWPDNPNSRATDPQRKATILAAYHERMSQRGLARVFGVSRSTVGLWLKKASQLPPLSQTLVAAQADEVLELDEMWSFVGFRKNKRWVWLAPKARSDNVAAPARSLPTPWATEAKPLAAFCGNVSQRLTGAASATRISGRSMFWSVYVDVLPRGQHRATGKGAGQTCHIERFNNIVRQRLGRFVRRTLSFSKNDETHEICLRLFLHEHNRLIKLRLGN